MTKEQKERYFDRAYIALTPLDSFLMCQHDERMDLKEMQNLVEGDIETVPTVIASHWADEKGVSILMVVNEEGKLHGMHWNPKATTLCGYCPDYIVGNALIVGVKGDELIALKRSAAEKIMRGFPLGARGDRRERLDHGGVFQEGRGREGRSMTRGQRKRAAKAQERREFLLTVAGTALGMLAIWVWMALFAVIA